MKSLKAYFELVRLPNVFTAMADAFAGYWLVAAQLRSSELLRSWQSLWSWQLLCLVAASAFFYAAGIILNDVRDIETDRRERPQRPLPSGRIPKRQAVLIATGISIIAVMLACAAGFVGEVTDSDYILPGKLRPGLVGVLLLATIIAYNFLFKGTLSGLVFMGLCRGLNLLMAMSVGWWFTDLGGLFFIIALIYYVASLTYFGFEEARRSTKFRLATGGFGIITAVLLLGTLVLPAMVSDNFLMILWFAFLVLLSRRIHRAIKDPSPRQVQYAMKTFILGIVVFDAILASATAGWIAGVCVLGLLVPTLLIGRWIYST
ncbi:MAG: UbiA family prenyltransferase [Phycisphaerales bacterium]|nr:UbiA family prenyltransferase [Phycisphaerales bacterium]